MGIKEYLIIKKMVELLSMEILIDLGLNGDYIK